MIRGLFFLALFVVTTAFSQNTAEDNVKAAIDTFFEGFHKGDTIMMKSVLMGKIQTQSTFKNKEGKDIISSGDSSDMLKAIASRTSDQKWDERLLDYIIKVDGNMASAWTPYEFWYNDNFSHCGVNSFQLFNDNGQWKIIYLVDSRRRSDCEAAKN